MNPLSPKQFFQESQPQNRDAVAKMFQESAMRNAMLFALTEMATRDHVTKEHLDGAKVYVRILMNMGDLEEKLEPFPSKELRHI